jgi:K+ transport systems, NAD-binding component
MGSALALLVIVIVSYIVVVVGAVAYELTGLDRSTARFQALSAFTTCGFTTRASERVVEHPVRRRITMFLIIFGYAGLASVVATVMRSLEVEGVGAQAEHLLLLALVAVLSSYLALRRGLQASLTDLVRRHLSKRLVAEQVPHEDLLFYRRGYGVTRVEIPPSSRVAGLRLRDTDLRRHKLQVLAIEDNGELRPIPHPDEVIKPGLHLVLYGRIDAVQRVFAPDGDRETAAGEPALDGEQPALDPDRPDAAAEEGAPAR